MPEWWYDGRRSDDEMYAFASLEWEENQRRKREEQQKVYGSTAERAAGLSPEQLAQADRILKEAREHFHQGLDALNNLMYTLPPEQRGVLQQSVIPRFEAAADKLQDTKDAITPQ